MSRGLLLVLLTGAAAQTCVVEDFGGWYCNDNTVYHRDGCTDGGCSSCAVSDIDFAHFEYYAGWNGTAECFSRGGQYYSITCSDDSTNAHASMLFHESDSTCGSVSYESMLGTCDPNCADEYSYSFSYGDDDCDHPSFSGWYCSYGTVYNENGCSDDTCSDCDITGLGWSEFSAVWDGSSFECFSPDGGLTYYAFTCSDTSSARSESTWQLYSDSACTSAIGGSYTVGYCQDEECEGDNGGDDDCFQFDGWYCSYGEVFHRTGCNDDTCGQCEAALLDFDYFSTFAGFSGDSFACFTTDGDVSYHALYCDDASSAESGVEFAEYTDAACSTLIHSGPLSLCEFNCAGSYSYGYDGDDEDDDPYGCHGNCPFYPTDCEVFDSMSGADRSSTDSYAGCAAACPYG